MSSWLAPTPPPRGRHLLQCRGQPQPLSHPFAPKYLFCSQLWGHSQGEGGEFLGSRTDSPMGGRGWLSAPRPSKLGTCLKLGPERGLFLKQKRGQEDISETPAGRPQERWSGMVDTHPWSLVFLRLSLSRAQRPGQPDGWPESLSLNVCFHLVASDVPTTAQKCPLRGQCSLSPRSVRGTLM